MCRTVHAVLQTLICGVQMLVRVLMTILLMIENLIRMVLQTLYNFISFMLQLLSLIPICVVFLVSARLKCFMCGGGGGCQPGRGGACDCVMSLVAIVILFFIFKSTGVMDKIFYSMGYAKAAYEAEPYVPTPGDITECSRNDTDQDIEYLVRTETYIATVETSAAAYLDALVEDYTQMLVRTKKKTIVPDEPEITTAETAETTAEESLGTETPGTNKIISAIVTTSSTKEEVEKETTGAIYTEAPEATEVINETEPSNTNEVVDSETANLTKDALDIEINDSPFNTATEAPDMGMSDTPND